MYPHTIETSDPFPQWGNGKQLGPGATGRDLIPAETICQLREDEAPYGDSFEGEKSRLSHENASFFQLFPYPITT